ncbi:hypothetical protein HYFRA_00007048 [Hymenoscyphus fraxineus]|uniref:2EXR domain-containing protein n=1 Tax=Hymenoscyphus fraxineus TaxID=746836 RepID=A0A9N9KW94_9HELO|nr:hypothetical protein HYFRA_00007048 [Hymenoscyphus fraxineus]
MALVYEKTRLPLKRPPDEPTFHLFPKLPAEIRLQIWSLAPPDDRVVEVGYSFNTQRWYVYRRSYTVCGLLRANKESRAEYLRTYLPLFPLCKTLDDVRRRRADSLPISHFNIEVDTLYIGPSRFDRWEIWEGMDVSLFRSLICPALKDLKYLAWEESLRGVSHENLRSAVYGSAVNQHIHPSRLWDNVRVFPNLREVAIVAGEVSGIPRPRKKPEVGAIKLREPRTHTEIDPYAYIYAEADTNTDTDTDREIDIGRDTELYHMITCEEYNVDHAEKTDWHLLFFGLPFIPRFVERGLFFANGMRLLPENEQQYEEFGFSG